MLYLFYTTVGNKFCNRITVIKFKEVISSAKIDLPCNMDTTKECVHLTTLSGKGMPSLIRTFPGTTIVLIKNSPKIIKCNDLPYIS